jgi:dimethylargininase
LSGRTNEAGVEFLRSVADGEGYEVVSVRLGSILHLKTAVAYLGDGTVVLCRGGWDDSAFAEYKQIEVPEDEAYAANCRSVGGTVLVAEGYPQTHERIKGAGFSTVELPTSEFRKAAGGLSCMSIIIEAE